MDASVPDRPTSGTPAADLAAQIYQARARTRFLTDDLSTDQLMGPKLDIVNPILWEIGHIGWFHEYWTLRHGHERPPLLEAGDWLWDSGAVAHDTRWTLDLPDRERTCAYLAAVMEAQVERLAGNDFPDRLRYFYDLTIRHEDMHVEALAYTRQTLAYPRPAPLYGGGTAPHRAGAWPGDVAVPGGRWHLGATTSEGFVFDNEKWAHVVELAPFRIARAPVTNAEFATFIDAGGYGRREFWGAEGWAWRERIRAERPRYWMAKTDGMWTWRRYDQVEVLAPDAPVAFVNWYEAEAWCRWANRRLPSEAEWEAAAIGESTADGSYLADGKRTWPWGTRAPTSRHANLDFASDGLWDVADGSDGDSAFGCRQMIGNVWEWTHSDFMPFPGFAADPYRDYSLPWFGTRKILRGGSFATSTRISRPGYRNFFTPERNDVFAGFRTCAL